MRALACADSEFQWFTERTEWKFSPGARGIKAVDDAGRIHGMVAYDAFTQNAAQMHVAMDSPAAGRALLATAFRYPFEECGFGVVYGLIPASHAQSYRLARHLGFRTAYTIKDGWAPGIGLVMVEMRREWCRYLSEPAQQLATLRAVGG